VAKRVCDREPEVLQAAAYGRMDAELQDHVAACADCRELLDVAAAILDDRSTLMREAHLPGAGLVWWRTNMRARQEAARAAVRAGSFVQVVLLVTAVVIAIALVGANLPSINKTALFAVVSSVPLFAFAAWLILAPVAVYFAVTEK